jgi:signal transduction histidine kinase
VSYPLAFVVASLLTGVGWMQNLVVSGRIPFEVVLFGIASTVAGSVIAVFMNETIKQSGERHELLQAVKIAQAKQAQAEREAGILQERQRMAQEIHDTLAQGFTSIVMHLEAAERALPNDPDKTNHHIIQARQMSRSSLEEARRLVWALRPEILESNSLAESLRDVVMNWSEANRIPAHFAVNGGPQRPLPTPIETTLLRIAQEALANIMKHAQAHHVNVTLSLLDDQVILDVLDDGIGFDVGHVRPNATTKSGLGLMGMRERIEKLGGSLLIESSPDEGAAIVAVVPLQSDIRKEHV